jgi:hypothetical protein
MKKIKFLLKELVIIIKKDTLIIITIMFSIIISMIATLVLSSTMYKELDTVFSTSISKVSYAFNLNGEDDLDKILNSNYLPAISSVLDIEYIYGGEIDEEMKQIDFNIHMYFHFDEDKEVFNSYDLDSRIIEGNYFSKEQLKTGEQVIILLEDTRKQYFAGNKVGDEIKVYGSYYKLVGVVDFELIQSSCFVPYTSLKGKKIGNDVDLDICGISIRFKKILNQRQKDLLQKDLKAYTGKEIKIESDFEKMLFDYYMRAVKYIFIIFAVILFCMLNIVGLFRYMIGRNMYSYVVYKLCGIKNSFFVVLVYTQSTTLMIISFLVAVICYKKIIPYMVTYKIANELPNSILIFCFILTLFTIDICLISTVRKVASKSPIDRILWR